MIYCLDTDICIDAMKGVSDCLRDHILSRSPREIKIPSLVKAELLLGARKSTNPGRTRAVVLEFLRPFEVLAFDDNSSETYADIRAVLEKSGTPIGPNDLIIAATILAHGATVVTRNVREFSRIHGLKVADWTS